MNERTHKERKRKWCVQQQLFYETNWTWKQQDKSTLFHAVEHELVQHAAWLSMLIKFHGIMAQTI